MPFARILSLFARQPTSVGAAWPQLQAKLSRTQVSATEEEQRVAIQHCEAVHGAWITLKPNLPMELAWFEKALMDQEEFRSIGRALMGQSQHPRVRLNLSDYYRNHGSVVSAREDLRPVFKRYSEALAETPLSLAP